MRSAVTMIFFNRPDTLQLVFDQVRQAQPPKLFLVQDGPREGNEKDARGVEACRKIVENIDWDCEVFRNYSDVNLGCGVRPMSGITWALSQVDSTIILEDDCVPDPTFFAYCDEMLERYAQDERIAYISGLNHFEEWDFGGSSYGFARGGAIWGWATWKRAWDRYDYAVKGITDPYIEKQLTRLFAEEKGKIAAWKKAHDLVAADTKISYWDVQWGFVKHTQNQMVIVPKYNLICNIGVGVDSTHAATVSSNHRKYKDYNNMPVKALEFPLIHPTHSLCDTEYDALLAKCNKQARSFWAAVQMKLKNRLLRK